MRVLGIDPGLRLTGYGVVDVVAGSLEPTLIEGGVIRIDVKGGMADRLGQLHDELTAIVEEHRPDCFAVEKLYAHYKHPRTAILMAHARGVILLCARQRGLPVQDWPSTEVKKSLTGYGHASKHQVQRAVQSQCGLAEIPSPPDVADAIAIALCHARRLAVEKL
ncbi:MAG: crossover junction endodeoxyribonuclease RuvC [Phycisphaeraceae bacterium]